MKLLYPQFSWQSFRQMGAMAVVGSFVAGGYGVVHDQVTFTMAPEYFTKLKFGQFAAADFGLAPRWLVAEIGFLASWWVGLLGGWFLGRLIVPQQSGAAAWRRCGIGFGITLVSALTGAVIAYGLSFSFAMQQYWLPATRALLIEKAVAFTSVACIHWGSYLGGTLGLAIALGWTYRKQRRPPPTSTLLKKERSAGL